MNYTEQLCCTVHTVVDDATKLRVAVITDDSMFTVLELPMKMGTPWAFSGSAIRVAGLKLSDIVDRSKCGQPRGAGTTWAAILTVAEHLAVGEHVPDIMYVRERRLTG